MQLDSRSNKILEALLSNPSINSKDLERIYNITRRQLGYSINKINDWLVYKNLPAIKRTRQGNFIIDENIFTLLVQEQEVKPEDMNVLSEKQRVYFIILMLLSNDDLSLLHFTSELDISKNTVLRDLKRAKDYVSDFALSIQYSRRFGYLIEGDEFQIRKLLIHVIYKVLEMSNGPSRLHKLANIHENEIIELKKRIDRVEEKLNLQFTDEKIITMPYTLILVLRRIKKGNRVDSFYIKYEELSDTKEYHATEEILYDIEDIPMEERLFITLHLLTTNVYWSEYLTEEEIPNLMQALDHMLRLFEKTACVFLQDKEQLLNKLLLHVKPAYYRIKYHLTEINDYHDSVSKEFLALHHLVKKSTKPLENLIGMEIPESETAYLTMLIGGWLTRQGDSIQEKVKAIVVCPSGVSVSRFMLSELRDLFPEFVFLDSLSVREFQHYKLDYDIVFSPIFLETEKKLFIANSFLEHEEKNRLRRQVMTELHGYIPFDINVGELIEIIKKHAIIKNEQELSNKLHRYINRNDSASVTNQQENRPLVNLSDLITPDKIQVRQSVSSWEEAIRTTAKPLIESRQIKPEYVEAMINHCDKDPYIVIGSKIAIPHAAPDEGVYDVSMSLLKLDRGVKFAEEYFIHIFIVIAAVDKHQHLKALMQLMKLAGSEEDIDNVIHASSGEEIYSVIKKYSIE